jgi:large subunit ribosomal protein L23
MDINIYHVIKGPVISDKAYKANLKDKIVLHVHNAANSVMIKEAVEKFFNVKVAKVNTLITKGKRRKVGRAFVEGKVTKRAYITLKKGYKINLFEQVESNNAQQAA